MHWRALTGGPAPSCGRQLSDLHSGPASQAPSNPPAVLHAAGSFLLSSFYVSSASSSHPSVFVHLLSTSCCFLISSLPTCLSLHLHARAAPWIKGNCRRGWESTVRWPKLPSAVCIRSTTASGAMRWAVQEAEGTNWWLYCRCLKTKIKNT